MPDANEEIVRRYLELDGYFVRSRVRYKYVKSSGGAGWSDVDLCGITPGGQAIAVEVKGWHTEKITRSHIDAWPNLFHFAERPEAREVLTKELGTDSYRKMLVVGELGPLAGQSLIDHAQSLGVEVLTFPTVLERMIAETPLGPDAPTDGEHMIRVLKRYGFLPSDTGNQVAPPP